MKYGLLGKKLSYSLSPEIHHFLGSTPYSIIEKNENDVEKFINEKNYTGLNITIPYKKIVFNLCNELDDISKGIGCVNTIIVKNNKIFGYNTDYYGFEFTLNKINLHDTSKKILLIGNGATHQTVVKVLNDKGFNNIKVVSRSGENHFSNFDYYKNSNVLINCTPIGMYPNVDEEFPIDINLLKSLEYVIDLNYNPVKTKLLENAEKIGLKFISGLYMLIMQAKFSSEIFQDKKIDDKIIEEIYKEILQKLK